MIDLHTHTKYSDGTWSFKEMLINAEQSGIDVLSITDHDTVMAYKEIKKEDYNKYFSGKIITGAEFNCMYNGVKIELLGYNFSVEEMNDWINEEYLSRNNDENLMREFNLLIEACHKNGVVVDEIDYNSDMGWPINYIYTSIKKHPENRKLFSSQEWNDINYFFRSFTCNINFPLYIDFSYQTPDAREVANKIREAGGLVFLAHLFIYPLSDYEEYLNSIIKDNVIDGIEVIHSKFNQEQINYLIDYCKTRNLKMSAGTDCHGDKKPDRKLGVGYGNMNVGIDLISDWWCVNERNNI